MDPAKNRNTETTLLHCEILSDGKQLIYHA